jgi:hypothetical protein
MKPKSILSLFFRNKGSFFAICKKCQRMVYCYDCKKFISCDNCNDNLSYKKCEKPNCNNYCGGRFLGNE